MCSQLHACVFTTTCVSDQTCLLFQNTFLSCSQLNVQEVPLSPQVDPTPCDYPSLHSTQFPDDKQSLPILDDQADDDKTDDNQSLPMAKRVFFAQDLCCYDDKPLVVRLGAHSVFTERGGGDVGPSTSDTLLDQALEDEEIVWSELEAAAQVVSFHKA